MTRTLCSIISTYFNVSFVLNTAKKVLSRNTGFRHVMRRWKETYTGWSSRPDVLLIRDQQYEEDQAPWAIEAPACDELNDDDKCSLSTDRSCKIKAGTRSWQATAGNPSRGEASSCKEPWHSSQFAERMTLNIAFKHAQEHQLSWLCLYWLLDGG